MIGENLQWATKQGQCQESPRARSGVLEAFANSDGVQVALGEVGAKGTKPAEKKWQ